MALEWQAASKRRPSYNKACWKHVQTSNRRSQVSQMKLPLHPLTRSAHIDLEHPPSYYLSA